MLADPLIFQCRHGHLDKVHAVGEQAVEGHPGASYDPARQQLTLQVDDDGNTRTFSFTLSV